MLLTCRVVFWLCFLAIAYNYIGYPVLLFILAASSQAYSDLLFFCRRKSRRAHVGISFQPRIAIILSAFNEETVIEQRVRNALSINYPEQLSEILIGLDSPTDSTGDILGGVDSPRVRVFRFSERRGKLRVISELARCTSAEILVFTDANTHFEPDCVAKLIRHFSDSRVGVVSGEEVRTTLQGVDPAAEGLYWKYESALKILESRVGCLHSANGGVYAIRRELFHPQPNLIVEDFQIPLATRFQGYLVVYDPEAIAVEEIAPTLTSQFERRVRLGAGNFQTLLSNPSYLNPLKGRPAFAYWSHRVLRWITPLMLILIFAFSAVLFHVNPYRSAFLLQTLFYLLALVGFWRKKRNKPAGVCGIPLYFCSMNFALVVGFFRYLSGRQDVAWKATPRRFSQELIAAKDNKQ
jgi:cellulose synthase/poly-beta-1,6-N-acetylglucosamine synthase-like glycosyltransferase